MSRILAYFALFFALSLAGCGLPPKEGGQAQEVQAVAPDAPASQQKEALTREEFIQLTAEFFCLSEQESGTPQLAAKTAALFKQAGITQGEYAQYEKEIPVAEKERVRLMILGKKHELCSN